MVIEIDEDKITILIQKTAEQFSELKEKQKDIMILHNQLRGIQKTKKGKLPISGLNKKPMKNTVREIIYEECLEAATLLKL